MYLIREIMYCKPGQVKPLVEKFKAMSRLGEKSGMPAMRIMTDLAADRYWTLVAEMEVESLQAFEDSMRGPQAGSEAEQREMESIMKDYHDLVDSGRREIYRIES